MPGRGQPCPAQKLVNFSPLHRLTAIDAFQV